MRSRWFYLAGLTGLAGVLYYALSSDGEEQVSDTGVPKLKEDESSASASSQPTTVAPSTGYYGRKWGNQRPPGLPPTARGVGVIGDALPVIAEVTRNDRVPFQKWAVELAKHESGATLALPANIFDARPAEQRPAGKSLITAWGALQFNAPAIRGLRNRLKWVPGSTGEPSITDRTMPWDLDRVQEIAIPLNRYRQVYLAALSRGFNDFDALSVTGLVHAGTGYARPVFTAGPSGMWQAVEGLSPAGRNWWEGHARVMARKATT